MTDKELFKRGFILKLAECGILPSDIGSAILKVSADKGMDKAAFEIDDLIGALKIPLVMAAATGVIGGAAHEHAKRLSENDLKLIKDLILSKEYAKNLYTMRKMKEPVKDNPGSLVAAL